MDSKGDRLGIDLAIDERTQNHPQNGPVVHWFIPSLSPFYPQANSARTEDSTHLSINFRSPTTTTKKIYLSSFIVLEGTLLRSHDGPAHRP